MRRPPVAEHIADVPTVQPATTSDRLPLQMAIPFIALVSAGLWFAVFVTTNWLFS
jgi:hypothetical protein